ncbi:hypothetical protein J3A83DRAFT_2996025 [Scleroderma citrinum]
MLQRKARTTRHPIGTNCSWPHSGLRREKGKLEMQTLRCFPQPNKAQTQHHNTVRSHRQMITHQTLYNLANYLGALAMITVVAYHFVAVNARYISQNGHGTGNH